MKNRYANVLPDDSTRVCLQSVDPQVCVAVYMHAHIHVHTRTCMHTHIHTRIHMYMYTCTCFEVICDVSCTQLEGSDYINASFLDGHNRKHAYIVTQVHVLVTYMWKGE